MKKLLFVVFLFANFAFASCDLDKLSPKEILNCDDTILAIAPIKSLLEVSRQIRGESVSCVGNAQVSTSFKQFLSVLINASYEPNSYAKTLPDAQSADELREAQRGYFRYWAYSAFYNFNKFREFWGFFNEAQTPLVKFYEKKGYETLEAAYYATAVLNEFLNYAVGGYAELLRIKPDISEAQKILSSNATFEQVMSLLYSKNLSKFELSAILNTALLFNKDEAILNEILKRGADLEFGDETAIFFALKSQKNVEFLIKNGSNVNHKNAFGKSAIFYAVELKDTELVKILLKNGANVNDSYIDQNTKTALLNLGQNLPFYLDMCGLEHTKRTLFMHAAAHATPEILKLLVQNGAKIDAVDEIGFNAVDYANMTQNAQNVKFLENLGLNANTFLGVDDEK
ncbi:ankyrin repeat domain-containing protein [Campylobacter gastrosuis]|uniref:Ankyrin repeat domain-containing protein n=1 Tax=Campylobacter gastrosuis TaxID=2974576 RepID=A0ABT7HSF5_9BACT|nr:ankyrin repeat domain-containing protein [Campylobacter gastrosuis]MDL0089348.1 ankyrin repeat domain-containing protein [Campylobacter gastrosuis]